LAAKAETLNELRRNKLEIVVTTFETCRDNIDIINSFDWEAVFADEAHKIKVSAYYMDKSPCLDSGCKLVIYKLVHLFYLLARLCVYC
jgi:hypothetical protein